MTQPRHHPSWRKPAGMGLILGAILLWAALIATFANDIGKLPGWTQILVYLIAGIVWIFPMKPLLRWMETGRFR